MKKFYLPAALAITMLNASVTFSQENSLDPVSVSASLSPQQASRTGRNIFVIRGEQFNKLPVHSIDDLLRYLPGLEVQARGPMGTQSDFVLRGGTFQQVLVVLDGMRLNDPLTGHFASYIPIAAAEIERIEILKGAASAIYGADAVGGVIQIFTKTYSAQQGIQKWSAGTQLTGGSYGLKNANLGGFYSDGRLSLGGGLISNNADGQQLRGIRGFFNNNTASLSYSYFIKPKLFFSFRTAYDDRDFAAQNFYTASVLDTATERVRSSWSQAQLAYTAGKHLLRFAAGYKTMKDRFTFNSRTTSNLNNSGLLQGLLTDEWTVSAGTKIVSGLQYVNRSIESNDRGDHSNKQAALFATLNQQFGSKFFVSPAARMEWNERSGWAFVPQVNLSYRLTDFQLRASAGRTIREADFTERFNNYGRATVPALSRLGNPDLVAETSNSYELGTDVFAGKNLKISMTYFRRDHSNLIDYIRTSYDSINRKDNLVAGARYDYARNLASVNTTGFETDIQYLVKLPANQQLWLTTGLVWINSNSGNSEPSFYVSSHAKFQANFSAQYSNKWFSIGINGLYRERKPMQAASALVAPVSGSYFLMNAKLEAFVWKQSASVFVQADNIFNRDYTDLLGSKMPGRWLMGGIKISLSK